MQKKPENHPSALWGTAGVVALSLMTAVGVKDLYDASFYYTRAENCSFMIKDSSEYRAFNCTAAKAEWRDYKSITETIVLATKGAAADLCSKTSEATYAAASLLSPSI